MFTRVMKMSNYLHLLIAAITVISLSQAEECKKIMDLCFLVDASSSVCDSDPTYNKATDKTCKNWNDVISLMHKIVDQLDIGEKASRVGVVVFSSKAYRRFNLIRYMNKTSLLAAIDSLEYIRGTTNTSGGLDVMRTMVFNESYGDRPNVKNVALIITDGKATDPKPVQSAIDQVHASGTKTYAIGISNEIDEASLKQLASEPKKINETYFIVIDFGALVQIFAAVQSQICEVPPASIDCKKMVDLCFLVDASASVCDSDPTYNKTTDKTCKNWNDMISFMHKTVEQLEIGEKASRVAVVVFSSKAYRRFNLTRYMNKTSLLTAIDSLEYTRGTTNTSGGLDVMRTMVFNESYGDRPFVQNVALIVTDGKATDPKPVQSAIDQVHASGTKTYAIGISNEIDEASLKQLASEPKKINETYFIVIDFSALVQIFATVQTQICEDPSASIDCSGIMDLCFVVDSSASICNRDPNYNRSTDASCNNWDAVCNFMHRFVDRLDIGVNATRVGMVVFASKGYRRWNMTKFFDKVQLLAAIDGLVYTAGTTNTSGGLDVMMNLVYKEAYGDRPNVSNVAVVITDGRATNLTTVPPAIDRVHGSGVKTYAIGITDEIDEDSVKQLASDPKQNETYFIAPDFAQLEENLFALMKGICRNSSNIQQ